MTCSDANKKYLQQRAQARMRSIPFDISFDDWYDIWIKSGHLDERGTGRGKYCMSRVGDKGGYCVGNVFIQLASVNVSDAQKGRVHSAEEIQRSHANRKKFTHTPESKRKMSETHTQLNKTVWNKGKTGVQVAWNKGLTSTDSRVAKYVATRKIKQLKEKSCD